MKKAKKYTSEETLQKLMRACSVKEMCEYDIRRKMLLWGIDESDQKKILKYLEKEKFYSNERFTTAFINDRLKFQKWGKLKIRRGLMARRIPEIIIDEMLNNSESDNYSGNLTGILKKKLQTLKGTMSTQEKKARLYRLGVSRGFESEMVLEVLNKIVHD